MGYYRNWEEKSSDDNDKPQVYLEATKTELNSFNELPQDVYAELMQRTLKMAERISDRRDELKEQFDMGELKDDAYWKTATIEQLAFLEMQIANIGTAVHFLTNKNTNE